MNDDRVVALRAAVIAAPGEPMLHVMLADALVEHGLFEDAAAEYRAALGLPPQLGDALYGLAQALARHNQPREGLEALDELRATAGESAREQMLRARIAFQSGD